MTHRTVRPGASVAAAALALTALAPRDAAAGQVATQPPPVTPYRAPAIAVVQPASGASVPQDRPVIVLRFAQGEPADPLDAASLRVWVDGVDRTSAFRVVGTDAWGALGDTVAAGVRQVSARICSGRGACGTASAPVNVTAPVAPAGPAAGGAGGAQAPPGAAAPAKESRKAKLIDLLLAGARKLLVP